MPATKGVIPLRDAAKVYVREAELRPVVKHFRVLRFGNGSVEARFTLTVAVHKALWAAGFRPRFTDKPGFVLFLRADGPKEIIFDPGEPVYKSTRFSQLGIGRFTERSKAAPKGTPRGYRKPRVYRP